MFPQVLAQFGAGRPGQHAVKQHQIGGAVERLQRVWPGLADSDLEAFLAQQVRQGVAH